MAYGIIAVVVLAVVAYFLISRKSNTTGQEDQRPFDDLRNMAFGMTCEQLGLSEDKELYGLIMDWNLGDEVVTLVAFGTGDASIYLSSGGGIVGGGQHESVRIAVERYLNTAERHLNSADRVDHSNLPLANSVNFYFLTTNGRFLVTQVVENFENESSRIYELFNEANYVITELRMLGEI